MADFHFKKAKTWTEMRVEHDRWVADYNYQPRLCAPAPRRQSALPSRSARVGSWEALGTFTVGSYLLLHALPTSLKQAWHDSRFRHWRLYGELGLAHQKANLWLSKEHLTVEYGDEPLSQYAVQYQPDDKHLRDIREPRHFATRYRTPQLDLWQTDAVEWHLVKRMPDYAPRRKRKAGGDVVQHPFPEMDVDERVTGAQ
jgi:hypothetical protein